MVTLTDRALERIRSVSVSEGRQGQVLRLRAVAGGCSGFSYQFAWEPAATGDDETYDFGDVHLVVDRVSLQFLDATEVDYVEGVYGAGFRFDNPKATDGCGCGQSFSV